MSLTEHERAMKRKLIDVTKELRKKIRTYRSGVNTNEESFQQMFKPISEPLTEVTNLVKQQQLQLSKTEPLLKQKIDVQHEALMFLTKNLKHHHHL